MPFALFGVANSKNGMGYSKTGNCHSDEEPQL
jgi:hypothetical protein